MTFCLDTKIIGPKNSVEIKNAIILLHGYGGDGNDSLNRCSRLPLCHDHHRRVFRSHRPPHRAHRPHPFGRCHPGHRDFIHLGPEHRAGADVGMAVEIQQT